MPRTTPRAAAARPRRSPKPAHWPTRWGSRTSPSTCARSSAPASWTRSSPATPRGRRPTRAWAATATSGWTRCWSWPTASAARRWRRATTPAPRSPTTRAGRCCASPPTPAKDQTYMLAALKPDSLARMRFPLGELRKPEVRRDRRAGRSPGRRQGRLPGPVLPGRDQPRPVHGAPRRRSTSRPGEIVDSRGAVLGRHDGQHRFTVGQRRGLGIAAAEPLFVLHKDARSARVTVGVRERTAHRPRRHPRRAPAPRRTPRRSGQAALSPAAAHRPRRRRCERGSPPLALAAARRAGRRGGARPAGLPDGRRRGGGVGDDRRPITHLNCDAHDL